MDEGEWKRDGRYSYPEFPDNSNNGAQRCFQLEDAFAEFDLPYRVDALDYHAIPPEFRVNIDEGNEKNFSQDER